MNVLINWTLKNNSKTLVVRKKQPATLVDDTILKYIKDKEKNEIDLVNKTYLRTTEEYTMLIDFNKSTCTFYFDKEGEASFNIKSALKEKGNEIIMEYKIDDDTKTIIVSFVKE